MKKSLSVLDQRKLAKQEITELIDQNLSAKILHSVGSLIQKATRQVYPPPWYASSILLTIIAILPQLLLALLLKESEQVMGRGSLWLLSVVLIIQVIPITYLVTRYTMTFIVNHIIDNIEERKDLEDLRVFAMQRLGNWRWLLIYALVVSLIWTVIAILTYSFINQESLGLALTIDIWIWGFCAPGIGLYYILSLMQVPSHLGSYHYQVYELNPAQSQVITDMVTLFTRPFLGIAVYLAICTAIASYFSGFLWVVVVLVVIFWIPLIIQFVNSQSAINNIISSAKWQTLNSLQERIRRHQEDNDLNAPENIESLNKLMDLYERVHNTNSFRLTIRSILELLNQLLLPLIAFVISNIDKVSKLFK